MSFNKFSSLSVPNAYVGEMKILNLTWSDELRNKDSEKFKILASELESMIANASFDPELSNTSLNVRVLEFLRGSVIVKFVIGQDPTERIINMSKLMNNLQRSLTSNDIYYTISNESITLDPLKVNCESLLCSESCSYNYTKLRFECKCDEQDNQCSGSNNKITESSTETDLQEEKSILMIKESIKLINKTIQNIAAEGNASILEKDIKEIIC